MNKISVRIVSAAILAIVALCASVTISPRRADANPSFFTRSAGTSSATTSPAYLTPGTATTTETFDTSTGLAQAMDRASLYLFLIGSSTNPTVYATTTYQIAIEYSDNCIDWGGDTFIDGTANSTTSQSQAVNGSFSRSVTLPGLGATLKGVALATTSGTVRVFSIPTPTRCVRAVATIPAGSTNGALWMRFVGTKQTQ